MRIFALSDIHVDYPDNARWLAELSCRDYVDDLLILAGDVSHDLNRLEASLCALRRRFAAVVFVPGNHDLWVDAEADANLNSWQKFQAVQDAAARCGVCMEPVRLQEVLVVPLLGWYDFSFGRPSEQLCRLWRDFRACRWPEAIGPAEVADAFFARNRLPFVDDEIRVITCSHFLPRPDLLKAPNAQIGRLLGPVLGSTRLEAQLRRCHPQLHVYGHSHLRQTVTLDGILYSNNALGYPQERGADSSPALLRIDQLDACAICAEP